MSSKAGKSLSQSHDLRVQKSIDFLLKPQVVSSWPIIVATTAKIRCCVGPFTLVASMTQLLGASYEGCQWQMGRLFR